MDLTFLGMIAGHISFGMTAIAYSMKRILWLRVIAVCSLTLSLFYNATLESGPLWLVLFWLSVFLVIHLTRITMEVRNNIEAKLTPKQRRLHADAFPTMHSADFRKLWNASTFAKHTCGNTLLSVGSSTEAVSMVVEGGIVEHRADGRSITRDPGMFWGELSFMMSDEYDQSPCKIVGGEEGCTILSIPYTTLRNLISQNPRMKGGLYESFARSAGVKHGLLEMSWFDRNHREQPSAAQLAAS